jgi:hypothetical protein
VNVNRAREALADIGQLGDLVAGVVQLIPLAYASPRAMRDLRARLAAAEVKLAALGDELRELRAGTAPWMQRQLIGARLLGGGK